MPGAGCNQKRLHIIDPAVLGQANVQRRRARLMICLSHIALSPDLHFILLTPRAGPKSETGCALRPTLIQASNLPNSSTKADALR